MQILRVSDCGKKDIKRIAICTGSGGDLISKVDADCFLSGDFKYHQALEALSNQISLIDLGHFESERYFSQCLAKDLKKFAATSYNNSFKKSISIFLRKINE